MISKIFGEEAKKMESNVIEQTVNALKALKEKIDLKYYGIE